MHGLNEGLALRSRIDLQGDHELLPAALGNRKGGVLAQVYLF